MLPRTRSAAAACAQEYGFTTDHVRGLLLETLDRIDEAVEAIETALAFLPPAYRPQRAEAAYDCARIRIARDAPGDRERARELIDEALGHAQKLGMRPLIDKLVALKLQDQGISTITDIYTSIDVVAESVGRERPEIATHAAPDGTVTIMFSDIEDSTVLTERLGDQAWQDLLRKHNALIREQLRAHDGYEVKTMGDGFMVAFQSAKKGLDCAIAIQRAVRQRWPMMDDGRSRWTATAIHPRRSIRHVHPVRIGLHAGEAIKDGDDFYGKNVILASRVAGKAVGGEILVSSLLRALVESSVGAAMFGEPREVELKGLAGAHTVFAVRREVDDGQWRMEPQLPPPSPSSIFHLQPALRHRGPTSNRPSAYNAALCGDHCMSACERGLMANEAVLKLRDEALGALRGAADQRALDAWRVEYLGRKGRLTGVLRGLGDLSIDERKAAGRGGERAEDGAGGGVRGAQRRAAARGARDIDRDGQARRDAAGAAASARRPASRDAAAARMLDVFRSMGFSIVEGPEVELDYYNFQALRIPADHPARDMWDTF